MFLVILTLFSDNYYCIFVDNDRSTKENTDGGFYHVKQVKSAQSIEKYVDIYRYLPNNLITMVQQHHHQLLHHHITTQLNNIQHRYHRELQHSMNSWLGKLYGVMFEILLIETNIYVLVIVLHIVLIIHHHQSM